MTAGNSAASRDIAYHLHPFTNLSRHETQGPLIITEGKGVFVTDEGGKTYLDAMAGTWCTSLGWGEPRLAEAAARQMRRLGYYHGFAHKSHPMVIDLAERLIKLAPVPMSKALFANSGSESNDTAVKLAWYYNNARGKPRKKKIIARRGAYHGTTVISGSLNGIPVLHRDFDLPIAQVLHTDCPHYERFKQPGESEEQFAARLADSLEQLILREDPETVAAFIAEPVIGVGGVIIPPRGYFAKVQAMLTKYDVLCIADEVICGFGRTGNRFGSETVGMKPDLMTVAKALSSAHQPISALLIAEPIYRAMVEESAKIGVFAHGFTYSGHPVAAAVALETLAIYDERDMLGHVRRLAPIFAAGLRRFADRPLVGEIRSVGLMGAIDLVRRKGAHEAFPGDSGVGPYLIARAHERGLIVRNLMDSTIAFSPPLIITEQELAILFERFDGALADTEAMVRERGLASG